MLLTEPVSITKRADPVPSKVDPEKQRDALAALDRLIAKSRAATATHSKTFEQTLAELSPVAKHAANELERLIEAHVDRTGCSYVDAHAHMVATQPDLVAKAVNE